LIKLII